jgi:ankyrin repeat protein
LTPATRHVVQDGLTALLAAACGEHSEVVKALLESGANVNAVEKVSIR